MKHRLKKINRGIVLAVILIIGLTIYIICDYSKFKKETPLIEQTLTDYITEFSEATVTPEKYQKLNAVYSDEDSAALTNKLYGIIDNYWTINNYNNNDWGLTKSETKGEIDSFVKHKERGFIKEVSVDMNKFIVKKDGPNSALVIVSYNLSCIGNQDARMLFPNDHYYYDEEHFDDEPPKQTNALYKHTNEMHSEVKLYRTKDGWKIYDAWTYSNFTHSRKINDTENS